MDILRYTILYASTGDLSKLKDMCGRVKTHHNYDVHIRNASKFSILNSRVECAKFINSLTDKTFVINSRVVGDVIRKRNIDFNRKLKMLKYLYENIGGFDIYDESIRVFIQYHFKDKLMQFVEYTNSEDLVISTINRMLNNSTLFEDKERFLYDLKVEFRNRKIDTLL